MRATRLSLIAGSALLALAAVPVTGSTAQAEPTWASAATAPIHPGVQTFTDGAQCTANFVFSAGATVYIGQAAHCASTSEVTQTDGCKAQTRPLGTKVEVDGASHPGVLVYSSWVTMQARHETDPDACAYNDLALVQLDPSDAARVNPSIPFWGGPVGLNTAGAPAFSIVYSYGNSELRLGLSPLSPKTGVSLGDEGGGWEHEVFTVSPGIPGDSGSAFLDREGRALGILSTLQVGVPGGVRNGVGDLGREVSYMHAHGGPAANLALGTEPFNPLPLPL